MLERVIMCHALCRPFLLQSKASYTQIGIFSVASYPYSFKLFWSPIVDSIYSSAFGRRKSWVVRLHCQIESTLEFTAIGMQTSRNAPLHM